MQKIRGLLCFLLLIYVCNIKTTLIWVKTQDHQIVSLEKWKIDEMSVLKSLLFYQHNDNSNVFPINVLTCTSHDLAVISHAFELASKGLFMSFFDEHLRCSLVSIAAQLEAIGMLILCVQDNTSSCESFFTKIWEKVKKYCNRIEYYPLGRSPVGNVNALACSSDGNTLIIHGKRICYAASTPKSEDSIVVWDIATQAAQDLNSYTNNISFPNPALSDDGSRAVFVHVDDKNRSCVVIRDVKSGRNKNIVVDDCIMSGECLRRPINVITFNPLHTNEFFVECFGYLGKIVVYERDLEQEDVDDEQIKLLYQLYLSIVSGHKIRLSRDNYMYQVYESFMPSMKKMICEEFGVEIY